MSCTGVVTTLAGSELNNPGYKDGTGTDVMFSGPYGVAVDQVGRVFVTEQANYVIRRINPNG